MTRKRGRKLKKTTSTSNAERKEIAKDIFAVVLAFVEIGILVFGMLLLK